MPLRRLNCHGACGHQRVARVLHSNRLKKSEEQLIGLARFLRPFVKQAGNRTLVWLLLLKVKVERETGIEPATSSLGSLRSTAELLPLG